MRSAFVFLIGLSVVVPLLWAQEEALRIPPGDVRIEQTLEGGYYLYVRKTDAIGSVLITESTEAPGHDIATYALRSPDYHSENGDELRMLDGAFLNSDGIYSLIDSTPVPDPEFGRAFRIFIPYVVVYGYPWSRNGEFQVLDGAYLSVRAFAMPYADYSGGYRDNPFVLRVSQAPKPPETRELMPAAVDTFTEIAEESGGEVVASDEETGVVETINRLIAGSPGRSLDLVLALDTTESMEDNIPELRENLVPMLRTFIGERDRIRVGMVYYRDYMEEYLTRRVEFHEDLSIVQRAIDSVRVAGGRDIPEAVYEALHAGLVGFDWQADDRLLVLVGDAPPHPRPRSWITKEIVQREASERGVEIHTIILPQ